MDNFDQMRICKFYYLRIFLSIGEKLAMTEEFQKEVALENEKKKSESDKQFYGNRFTENKESVESTPIGVQSKSRSNTWTDSQTAKKAGVGVGSVARDKNNEAKQRKVALEYVRLCGSKNGGDRQAQCQVGTLLSLDEIASQLGTSKTNLKRALSIERNLTEPMKFFLTCLSPIFVVEAKSVDQQRRLEDVLKNWKDCMGLEMVLPTKKEIIELVNRKFRMTN